MDQEFGICRLSVVPVRHSDSDKSEMVSQLLFGEHYTVLEKSKNRTWLKINNHFDGYEGWISSNQHSGISMDYFEQVNNSDYKITLDVTSNILFKKNRMPILLGSILPIATNELFKMEEQLAYNGNAKSLSQRYQVEQIMEIARKYLDAPYLWGGKSPFGIDCSGFTQIVFKIGGYKLKRDASQQINQGWVIDKLSAANPGDLVFFENAISGSAHVGIVMEEQQVIHASGKVRIDTLTEEGIFNEEWNKLTHKLTGIRRITRK